MPGLIRTMLTQKSKLSIDYLKVILPIYVFVLLLFVVGMIIATIWH